MKGRKFSSLVIPNAPTSSRGRIVCINPGGFRLYNLSFPTPVYQWVLRREETGHPVMSSGNRDHEMWLPCPLPCHLEQHHSHFSVPVRLGLLMLTKPLSTLHSWSLSANTAGFPSTPVGGDSGQFTVKSSPSYPHPPSLFCSRSSSLPHWSTRCPSSSYHYVLNEHQCASSSFHSMFSNPWERGQPHFKSSSPFVRFSSALVPPGTKSTLKRARPWGAAVTPILAPHPVCRPPISWGRADETPVPTSPLIGHLI